MTDDMDPAKLAAFRARRSAAVETARQQLEEWLKGYHLGDLGVVEDAMLEKVIDSYIELHGPTDAFDFIERAFRRRVEAYKRTLQ
jgi:hypothetical protein